MSIYYEIGEFFRVLCRVLTSDDVIFQYVSLLLESSVTWILFVVEIAPHPQWSANMTNIEWLEVPECSSKSTNNILDEISILYASFWQQVRNPFNSLYFHFPGFFCFPDFSIRLFCWSVFLFFTCWTSVKHFEQFVHILSIKQNGGYFDFFNFM